MDLLRDMRVLLSIVYRDFLCLYRAYGVFFQWCGSPCRQFISEDINSYCEASAFRMKEICRNTLAKDCGPPEISGKITNCLAFRELPVDALADIVSKFVIEKLQNYDMELEHMEQELMVQLKEQHSNYGARGVKAAVGEAITAATVYDYNIERYRGKKVTLSGNIEDIVITIIPEEQRKKCF